MEVVYAVSGWLKNDPRTYSVQLVPRAKLQGVYNITASLVFLNHVVVAQNWSYKLAIIILYPEYLRLEAF